jgi:hypothetical protein
MNFSGLGGVTLAVVSILWIFVFIPSWFNASTERREEVAANRATKKALREARAPIKTQKNQSRFDSRPTLQNPPLAQILHCQCLGFWFSRHSSLVCFDHGWFSAVALDFERGVRRHNNFVAP